MLRKIIFRSLSPRTVNYDYSTNRHWRRHYRFRLVSTILGSLRLLGRLRGPPSPKHFVQLNNGLQLCPAHTSQAKFRIKQIPLSSQLIEVTRSSSLVANIGEIIGRLKGSHLILKRHSLLSSLLHRDQSILHFLECSQN